MDFAPSKVQTEGASSPTPSTSSLELDGFASFMEEPESFRPKTSPPTVRSYVRRLWGGIGPLIGPEEVKVGLVSGHPLWGHILYPAAIAMARFLELHSEELLRGGNTKGKGKHVLELGAGGGLPGIIAALEGAEYVVISDFPDPALIKNIDFNIRDNIPDSSRSRVLARGFTWGSSPKDLLGLLQSSAVSNDEMGSPETQVAFDLILLSDVVFNHSQHGPLLDSCLACLKKGSAQQVKSRPSSSDVGSQVAKSEADHLLELPDMDQTSIAFPPPSRSSAAVATTSKGILGLGTQPSVLCFYSHHRPTPELVAADLNFIALAKAKGFIVKRVWKDEAAGPAFPEDDGDLCIRSTVHGWCFTLPA